MFSVKTLFGSCIFHVNFPCKMWHICDFKTSLFSMIFLVAFGKRIKKNLFIVY